MSNRCTFCQEKTETSIIILTGEDSSISQFLEFCNLCGDKGLLTNDQTGKVMTPKQLFNREY
jgi:hypothetical protein